MGARAGPGVSGVLPFVQQLYAFGMTIVAGMAAGVVFDLYRMVRRGLRPRGTGAWLTDLLFWLVVTPVVFALLLLGNWGELRFYVFLGLAAGGVLYFGLLSGPLRELLYGVFWNLGRLLFAVGRILVGVLMIPAQILGWLTALVARPRRWAGAGLRWGFGPGWRRPFSSWFHWGTPFGRRL